MNSNSFISAGLLLYFLLNTAAAFGQLSIQLDDPLPALFKRAMSVELPTTAHLDTLINLSQKYISLNPDTSIILAERAVALSKAKEDQRSLARALLMYAQRKHHRI